MPIRSSFGYGQDRSLDPFKGQNMGMQPQQGQRPPTTRVPSSGGSGSSFQSYDNAAPNPRDNGIFRGAPNGENTEVDDLVNQGAQIARTFRSSQAAPASSGATVNRTTGGFGNTAASSAGATGAQAPQYTIHSGTGGQQPQQPRSGNPQQVGVAGGAPVGNPNAVRVGGASGGQQPSPMTPVGQGQGQPPSAAPNFEQFFERIQSQIQALTDMFAQMQQMFGSQQEAPAEQPAPDRNAGRPRAY